MRERARILVVDDELPVCKSVAGALAKDDYDVDMALSAEEALRKESESAYDVIVTDLMMPGLSGMDLLKSIAERSPETKVIMITGYPSIRSAVESTKLGAFDYIPKPFTPGDLRSLVVRALESRRYHKEHKKPPVARGDAVEPVKNRFCIPENSWALVEENGNVRIGVHHVFLSTIKEITSVELPKAGDIRYQGEVCARITDSGGHIHRIWTPVSGEVIEINKDVTAGRSGLIADPYGEGWLLVMKPSNLDADLESLVAM